MDDVELTSEDGQDRQVLGAVDRLVCNAGIALLAVIPTALAFIATPKKLIPLIHHDRPEGRMDFLLSPGIFFLLANIFALTLIALSIGDADLDPTREQRGISIGGSEARAILQNAGSGDIPATIAVLTPLFLAATVFAAGLFAIRPLVGSRWSLIISLRTSFYLVSGMMLILCMIAFVIISLEDRIDGTRVLNSVANIMAIAIIIRFVFCAIHNSSDHGVVRSLGLSILASTLGALGVVSVALLSR